MILGTVLLAGSLLALQPPSHMSKPGSRAERKSAPAKLERKPAPEACERVTLRDGSVVLGLVTGVSTGPRGAVELVVRRDWAESHLKRWAGKWDVSIEPGERLARRQRRERLAAWRAERAASAPNGDRIVVWIDQELKRLEQPAAGTRSFLLPARLARTDVRSIVRQPAANTRLLQLGWLCGLPDAESMPLEDLKDALENRGFVTSGGQTPSLAGLLPALPEPELAWLARAPRPSWPSIRTSGSSASRIWSCPMSNRDRARPAWTSHRRSPR